MLPPFLDLKIGTQNNWHQTGIFNPAHAMIGKDIFTKDWI